MPRPSRREWPSPAARKFMQRRCSTSFHSSMRFLTKSFMWWTTTRAAFTRGFQWKTTTNWIRYRRAMSWMTSKSKFRSCRSDTNQTMGKSCSTSKIKPAARKSWHCTSTIILRRCRVIWPSPFLARERLIRRRIWKMPSSTSTWETIPSRINSWRQRMNLSSSSTIQGNKWLSCPSSTE